MNRRTRGCAALALLLACVAAAPARAAGEPFIPVFTGREEPRPMALNQTSLGVRAGRNAYDDFVENGLSVVRDRDEAFLRIRYTF